MATTAGCNVPSPSATPSTTPKGSASAREYSSWWRSYDRHLPRLRRRGRAADRLAWPGGRTGDRRRAPQLAAVDHSRRRTVRTGVDDRRPADDLSGARSGSGAPELGSVTGRPLSHLAGLGWPVRRRRGDAQRAAQRAQLFLARHGGGSVQPQGHPVLPRLPARVHPADATFRNPGAGLDHYLVRDRPFDPARLQPALATYRHRNGVV